MKFSMRHILIGGLTAAVLVGCGPNGEMTRAEQGAVIGGLAGAVIGKNTIGIKFITCFIQMKNNIASARMH